ncbi:MAG: TlpA disulfide reductase family protein [Chloroflexota bacterium]
MIRFRSPSRRLLGLFVAVPFIAAACTTSASDSTDDAATAAAATDAAAGAEASWLDIELTDAETGEPFSLASLGGEVVAIEPMAIWCSNCRAQQDNVKEVYDQIEASGVTYISLGIDPGENPDSLAAYAERRGYEWTFAQSPVELSRALSDRFGPQILSAPSTPLIVLDSRGEVTFQDFGFHGPEQLLGILEEASA